MAAAVGDGYMPPMHPFFQKASIKTNGKPPTPAKSEDTTSTTEETHSPRADSIFYIDGNEGSPNSIPASQPGEPKPQNSPNGYRVSNDDYEKIDAGINGDFTIDLNFDRRKRRKIRTPAGSPGVAQGNGNDWLHQLEEAAVDGAEPAPASTSVAILPLSDAPSTRNPVSKEAASTWRTPRRTRKNAAAESSSTESTTDGAASPASGHPIPSPTLKGTPKKKLLKLNTNGKLLSSPVSINPVSKSKGRSGDEKHDKHPKTKRIILKYGSDPEGRSRIGMQIDEVLGKSNIFQNVRLSRNDAPTKMTHPFFLGKRAQKLQSGDHAGSSDTSSIDQVLGPNDKPTPLHATVAWKDIVFTSQKPTFTKTVDAIDAPWPPVGMQHLGTEAKEGRQSHPLKLRGATTSKSKEHRTQITTEEDIMQNFSNFLHLEAKSSMHRLRLPQRIVATGDQMLAILDGNTIPAQDETKASDIAHPAIRRVRSLLPTSSTAFDQGKAGNGNAWTVQYAPCSANDILQPTASLLRDWMRSLTTSVTQKIPPSLGGKMAQTSKRVSGKKKRRKISYELEGFIASSDGESEEDYGSNVKNAVLISGPPGCGKTASIFAVAKELDFEVFEVHPGMRRSAKDIFDKVGDMTQNHLVQGVGDGTMPEIEPSTIDLDSMNQEIASGKQGTMRKFFSKTQTRKQRKSPPEISGKEVENAKALKTQKQSVILFEEVDVLFDEDKGFWSGVVSLISQSKRPIVLTCNDESSVPFDDLLLHATWRYEPPTLDLASEYLVTLAANEGHILSRDCVRALFKSKGQDLRGTINELDFWCQMGIGSQKGGLDWMLDPLSNGPTETADTPLRVFSKDTYASGAGLALPSQISNDRRQEELLNHAQNYLEIPVTYWHEASDVLHTTQSSPKHVEPSPKRIDDLQRAVKLLDSYSVLDLFDESLTATLSIRIKAALAPNRSPLQEADVVHAYLTKTDPTDLTKGDLLSALEPLTEEKASFPPALGRLAPSFEGPTSIVAVDIAPYVRSIAAFDQRLEQQRKAMTGDLQGRKVRKTRAARAALEGGSKANTRGERWFPERTDFEKVMKTAGKGWLLWGQDEDPGPTQSQYSMEASSPESDPNEDEH